MVGNAEVGRAVIFAPLARLNQGTAFSKIFGTVLAYGTSIVLHLGFVSVAGLFVTSWADWYYGREIARANGTYSEAVAHLGKVSKLAGIFLVAFILGLELWVGAHPGWPHTEGYVSSLLAFWLIASELRSIVAKLKSQGKAVPEWIVRLLGFVQTETEGRAAAFLPIAYQKRKPEESDAP